MKSKRRKNSKSRSPRKKSHNNKDGTWLFNSIIKKASTPKKISPVKNDVLPEQLSKHAQNNYYQVDELLSKCKELNRQANLLGKIIDKELKVDNDPIIKLCNELLNMSSENQKLFLAKLGENQGIPDNIINQFMLGKRVDRYFKMLANAIYKIWNQYNIASQTGNFIYTLHGNPIVKGSAYLSTHIFDMPEVLNSYGRTIICDIASPFSSIYPLNIAIAPICIGIYGYYFYIIGDCFFETIRPLTPYKDDTSIDVLSMTQHYLHKFLKYNAKNNAFIDKIAKVVDPLSNNTITAYNISTNIIESISRTGNKTVHILEAVEGAVDKVEHFVSNIDKNIKGISDIIENNNILKIAVGTALPLLLDKKDADKIMEGISKISALSMPSQNRLPMPSYDTEFLQIDYPGEDDD